MSKPEVSFIIIAYNEEPNIGRCLDSIKNQKGLKNYEIIVVDDASKDGTSQVVENFSLRDQNVKLIRFSKNKGRGAARAAGVKAAGGDYFVFVDGDTILPSHWLKTCFENIKSYDAVGGIAIPDGDVNYVYRLFNLAPKIANHTTTVTGNNGLYKRKIFESLNFDSQLKDGEDVAFNHVLESNNFKTYSIPGLTVIHRESKSFFQSLRWLYESGIGATRQFKQFRVIRLPDLAFLTFCILTAASTLLCFLISQLWVLNIVPAYLFLTSFIFLSQRFYIQTKKILNFVGAVVLYAFFLLSYFIGRFIGIFKSLPRKKNNQTKKILLSFDFEGKWGMPFHADYDLEKNTKHLLSLLSKYEIRAVFFCVGKVIEENPNLIKLIADKGHEVAIHGYNHEHYEGILTSPNLEEYKKNISYSINLVKDITGKKPIGFRSPYLLAPVFFDKNLYSLLKKNGFQYVSNREMRFTEEIFHPHRIAFSFMWGMNNGFTKLLELFLNWKLVLKDNIVSNAGFKRIVGNIRWILGQREPFMRDGLIEVPLSSPLDCDLLGLPDPSQMTSKKVSKYTVRCLVRGVNRPGSHYMLTFHDWIITSANRIEILSEVLKQLDRERNTSFVLSKEFLNI
ncbi:MAG TPA: glycosyltransferase [Candidatus Paceibacterota bacterium]|nr:glycosyltransferase [Candidatus Paceibacterota bacterium]